MLFHFSLASRIVFFLLIGGTFAHAQLEDKGSASPNKSTISRKSNGTASKEKAKTAVDEAGEPAPDDAPPFVGIELFAPQKMEMQFGMKFFSNDNFCSNLHATIPFPLNWPEQTVTVKSSQMPQGLVPVFRDLPIGSKQNALARQLVMDIPGLGPNNQLDLLVNVEIEKFFINPPADPSIFVIPNAKKLGNEMRFFIGKGSPYIDHELGEIKRVARQIASDNPENAWTQVERLYDWVRENIEYRKGKIRHMRDSLKDKKGDCEEMTGIFVALCRASNIPARCVWIPEHCYPEFYLEDPKGEGHWFPCQVAGDRQFGQMHDYRPILQKGDRFKIPEDTAMQRYIVETFTCKSRPSRPNGLEPNVEAIRDLGPLQAQLNALQQQGPPPAQPNASAK